MPFHATDTVARILTVIVFSRINSIVNLCSHVIAGWGDAHKFTDHNYFNSGNYNLHGGM